MSLYLNFLLKRSYFIFAAFILFSACADLQTSLEKSSSDNFDKLFLNAKIKVEAESYSQAKTLLEEYLKKAPLGKHVDQSLFFLGQLSIRDKKYSEANNYLNQLIAKVPGSSLKNLARFYRAKSWDLEGKKLEALASLSQINDREGTFSDTERIKLFLFWGKLARENKQFRDAALAFRRAYHLSEELKNTEAFAEASVQVQSVIQNELNIQDLEEFLKIVDSKTVPGMFALKRYEELKITGLNPVETPTGYSSSPSIMTQPTVEGISLDSEPLIESLEGETSSAETPFNLAKIKDTSGEEGKVGLLLPVDNAEKPWGKAIYEGMLLAIKKNGSAIKLVVADPGSNVESAKKATEHLINQEKVMAVVGPLTAEQAVVAAKKLEEVGVPFLSTSPRTNLKWGGTTINFSFDFKKQAMALAKYASQKLNASRYAMLFPRDDFGKGFAESFYSAVQKVGGNFTAIESYPVDQKDFRKNVENMVGLGNVLDARWKEKEQLLKDTEERLKRPLREKEKKDLKLPPIVDFDVVFIPDSYKAIGQIAPLFAYYDISNITLLGPSTWNSPQVLQRAGQFLDKSIVVDFFSKNSQNGSTQDFIKNFQVEYGKIPGVMNALGFDLASSIDKAMKENSGSRKKLMQSFIGLGEFLGVIGLEKWDENRDPISEIQIFQILKNKIEWQQPLRIR
jgi:ABC-type branched-subunit amino acid transport system substrate-binding protein/outer membrane protein assembly factor BamD (BamD/ComL family)